MLPEILLSTLLLAGVYGFPSTPADQLKTPRSEYFIVQPAIKPQPQLLQTYSIQAKPDSKDQYVLLYPNQYYYLRDDESWLSVVQNWWQAQQQSGSGEGGPVISAAGSPSPASPASPQPEAPPAPAMKFFLKPDEESGKDEKKYYYIVPAGSPSQFFRQVNPFQIIPSVQPVLAAPANPLEPKTNFVLQPVSLRSDFRSEPEQQQQQVQQVQQAQPQPQQLQQQQPQFFSLRGDFKPDMNQAQPQQMQPQQIQPQQQFLAIQQEQRKDEMFAPMNAAAAAFMSGQPMAIPAQMNAQMAMDAAQMNAAPKSDFFISPVAIRAGDSAPNSENAQQAMQRVASAAGNIGVSLRSGGSDLESVLLPDSASLPLNTQPLQLLSPQQPQRLLGPNAGVNKEQQSAGLESISLDNSLLQQTKSNVEARNEQNSRLENINGLPGIRSEQNNNDANQNKENQNEEKRKEENQNEQNSDKQEPKPSEEQGKREEKRKDESSIAQAKPHGLSLAGEGGVASSSPSATALVGKNGLALASPSATAVAGDFGSLAGGGLLSSRE